ncbi:cytochrome P450 [Ramlibacter tataouinensis]|uniref:Cytochromes P450-like protein n=1 Tax=Ramlibacter tataouinensis (strain ATCC BAA-407 / DSM 14655 / LMG 21543 / TTB310) TaxID=365046 RepID=F5Y2Z7_RAMTT|nr:cytochrome P450 [Ramlibacter tataouinensis]AEG94877.1 cytochromes P450-like protein [Ramlibacter tataouinensis TTB310]
MNRFFTAPKPARPIPVLAGPDHTLAFAADPYRFIGRECAARHTDVAQGRLLLAPTLFLTGAPAAQLFYDKERFVRAGAAPEPLRATLFGKGAVQTLDGSAHLRRKAFFLEATAPARVAALVRQAEVTWLTMASHWRSQPQLVLYTSAQEWLTRSVCAWAGVPLPEHEVQLRTGQLAALFDSAASGLGAHLRARRARRQAETWLAGLVQEIRDGRRRVAGRTLLQAAAELTDERGEPLPARIAAVELLNVLRPTVAVSVFVVFAAHALHHHPGWAPTLAAGGDLGADAFVQEVRRFYPFFPAIAARVRRDFVWEGYHFPQGRRVLLDLYGTNHDGRLWPHPGEFRPERFMGRIPGLFELVPQGGGRADDQHRCPGEGVTLALMKLALRLLVQRSRYRLPPQNLAIDMRRLPALPRDRFVIADFQPV